MGLLSTISSYFSSTLKSDSGYTGANKLRRLKNWRTSSGSPDGEILRDLALLRERGRDLYKNNAIGRGAIKLLVNNAVGRGIKMQSTVERDIIQKHNNWSDEQTKEFCDNFETQIERHFNWWAESTECDALGQMNFYEKTQLAFSAVLQSGEVFATMPLCEHKNAPFRLKIGLIESDQVQSPNGVNSTRTMRDGVATTPDGLPLGYWVNTNQEQYPQQYKYIPKYGEMSGRPLVLHLFKSDRPGQSRGVPFLAPIMETVKKLDDYKRSELDAAEMSANLVAAIESDNPNALAGNGITGASGTQSDTSIQHEGQDLTMAPGAIWQLFPGEKLTNINPTRPNTAYEAFTLSLMREVGMGVSIPYEILIRHFSSSYSASRAARVEFDKELKVWREWLEFRWCQPIYKEFVIEEILSGRIVAPGFTDNYSVMQAYFGGTWSGEAAGQIDPTKEVEAAASRVKYGFSTATQESREMNGNDYASNLVMQSRERDLRNKTAAQDPFLANPIPQQLEVITE